MSPTLTSAGTIDGTGTFLQTAGSTRVDGTMTQTTIEIAAGTLSGIGTVEATDPNGLIFGVDAIINTGNSAGELTLIGDTLFQGTLLSEIESISVYDVLNINGNMTLDIDSVFDVDLLGGFSPQSGDIFDVLLADSIIGQFGSLLLPGLDPGLHWELDYLVDEFGSTDVLRVSAQVPVPPAFWLFGSEIDKCATPINRKSVRLSIRFRGTCAPCHSAASTRNAANKPLTRILSRGKGNSEQSPKTAKSIV